MSRHQVGCDLVSVADVASSVANHGDRYLTRVYTPHEVASCQGPARAAGLAGRFAAKEAVIKVLRPTEPIRWSDIEIRQQAGGWCDVVLSGAAAELAHRTRISEIEISLSHDHAMAIAFAVGTVETG